MRSITLTAAAAVVTLGSLLGRREPLRQNPTSPSNSASTAAGFRTWESIRRMRNDPAGAKADGTTGTCCASADGLDLRDQGADDAVAVSPLVPPPTSSYSGPNRQRSGLAGADDSESETVPVT